ncbi:MAG: molybdenum cofactor guanylyltransferase MobA [Paracoccus denitrificans]|uniref:Molybdenum cofactor guanylyltransferase n=1 Tax=Paracoccus denitrificans TaxID=266 RepID=A0A533IBI5_PARDE|nr:MAG: molybdenum cofactor guanylyltransferase MobA [Paracoccus denitrificans]
MTEAPPAVILAGGQSSRMGGGDKVLLDLNGRPLLAHVIARLRPQAGPLALSANGDPARFAGFGLPVLADSLPDFPGPLAGILAGMDWAAGLGADAVLVAAGDTPFLPLDLVEKLRAAAAPSGMALAANRESDGSMRLHPTFGLWPLRLRPALRAALLAGDRRIRAFTARHDAATALFNADTEAFFNVNTPEDLARAATIQALG